MQRTWLAASLPGPDTASPLTQSKRDKEKALQLVGLNLARVRAAESPERVCTRVDPNRAVKWP